MSKGILHCEKLKRNFTITIIFLWSIIFTFTQEVVSSTYTKTEIGTFVKSESNIELLKEKLVQAQIVAREGNYEDAILLYQEILEIEPQFIEAHRGLALTYFKTGCFKDALQKTEQLLYIDKNSSLARIVRSLVFFKEGKFEKAEEEVFKALELDPINGLAYFSYGNLLAFKGQREKAIRQLESAIMSVSGENELFLDDFYLTLGSLLVDKDKMKAITYLQKGIESTPNKESIKVINNKALIEFCRKTIDVQFYQISQGTISTRIPLKTSPLPSIKVSINNAKPINFIVDTGAGLTVLSPSVAKKYGIQPLVSGIKAYAAEGTINCSLGLIDSLYLGEIAINNVPVLILEKEVEVKLFGVIRLFKLNGVIGLPVIQRFITTIDYPGKCIVLEHKESQMVNLTSSIKIYGIEQIFVHGQINESQVLNFLIDTGGNTCSIINSEVAKSIGITQKLRGLKKVKIMGGEGIPKSVLFGKIDYIMIGGVKVKKVPIFIGDLNIEEDEEVEIRVDGTIGNDFFRKYKVTFNFSQMQMYLREEK